MSEYRQNVNSMGTDKSELIENIEKKTKKSISLKKSNLLAQTQKWKRIKLQNFLSIHFYKCRSHIL